MKRLMEVKGLKKYFPIRSGIFGKKEGYVKAVDDVSFAVNEGETLGIVGESGCGKSTTGRTIIRLLEPTSGEVIFQGENLFDLKGENLRKMRRNLQIVFQDPYASLNPRMTISQYIYNLSFKYTPDFGYAATVSYAIVVLIIFFSIIQFKVAGDKND